MKAKTIFKVLYAVATVGFVVAIMMGIFPPELLICPALVPTFLFDFESEMMRISENEFARMTLSENLWYREVTKVRNIGGRKLVLGWLLSTAKIEDAGLGGNITFDDMAAKTQEYLVGVKNKGLKLRRDQVEDNDGDGFDFAGEWSAQMGAQMAYWPQRAIADLILAGEGTTLGTAYDGLSYFNTAHPVNPFNVGLGLYANIFTGAASGGYPGALALGDATTLDQARINLSKAQAYIAGILMPNGRDPRFLIGKRLIGPPRMRERMIELTSAEFIAKAASSGGGSSDLKAVIKNWAFLEPIVAPELGSAITGDATDDTTCYLAAETITTTQLGSLVYIERLPFSITYYTGQGGGTGVDAILDRSRELEWHVQGRNGAGYGHPYSLFKLKAA